MNLNQDPQEEVIEVLREGRATPRLLLDETSIDEKQTVQYHLRQLRAEDRVQKVCRGLYALDPSERTEMPAHATIDTDSRTSAGDEDE